MKKYMIMAGVAIILIVALRLAGCSDHKEDQTSNNINNVPVTEQTVE